MYVNLGVGFHSPHTLVQRAGGAKNCVYVHRYVQRHGTAGTHGVSITLCMYACHVVHLHTSTSPSQPRVDSTRPISPRLIHPHTYIHPSAAQPRPQLKTHDSAPHGFGVGGCRRRTLRMSRHMRGLASPCPRFLPLSRGFRPTVSCPARCLIPSLPVAPTYILYLSCNSFFFLICLIQ